MRSRGLFGLIGMLVCSILGVMTMRACSPTGAGSASNPANVARNGVAGTCANQQSVADAGSSTDAAPAVTVPPDLAAKLSKADPALAAVVGQAALCGSTTTEP